MRVDADPGLAALAMLDALSGEHLSWSFLDEALRASHDHGWPFRKAVRGVLASRARRLGVAGDVDVDALAALVMARLPALAMRA